MRYSWLSVLSVLSAVLLADLATPPASLWGNLRVKHTWNTVPANWENLGPPPNSTTIDLHIALKPRRKNALIDALYEVSDPGHQNYGSHLTKEQAAELVAPHQDTLGIVYSWLKHHGVPTSSISTSHGGGWLTITGTPVSQADKLLGASYQLYKHTRTKETEVILRTVSYALPAVLHAHVQTVAPTTHFASLRMPLQTARKHSSKEAAVMMNATSGEPVRMLSSRVDSITPPFLRWLYKTQAYAPAAMSQNVLGILGLGNEYPSMTDLTQFMTNFRADAAAATFTVNQVNNGGYDPSDPGSEANLDTQYAEAMAYPISHVFYSTGGHLEWSPDDDEPAHGDAYLRWLKYLFSQSKVPPTISISYGNPEQDIPQEYATTLCDLFAQLGARGASVLVASGDYGVGHGDCKDSSGKKVRFKPMFPASCPWVTSVGGTMGYEPEVGGVSSGGGFSIYFPRANYQDRAVLPFLQFLGIDYVGLYQPEGRGIPDVSAQSLQLLYIYKSILYVADGTSFSAPIVAGIVSMLNDYMLSTGRAPLGFLNYWLYGRGLAGLNDITSGSNPGCNTEGFFAIPGWDPVTGLGTLDFEKLLYVLATVKTPWK